MKAFSAKDFDAMFDATSDPCVSIYMPMRKTGKEVLQNTIRFKNLMEEVEKQFDTLGDLDKKRADEISARLTSFVEDPAFNRDLGDGLAVFCDTQQLRAFDLPFTVAEAAVVSNRYFLKPLFPLVVDNDWFFVLTITQDEGALFRCNRHAIEPLDVPDMPQGIADTLKFDEAERQFQFYTGSPPAKGHTRAGIFHGQDVVGASQKDHILRYCQDIDKAVRSVLKQQQAPLMTAGLAFVHPIYREANSYVNLLEDGIVKDPKAMTLTELHSKAWQLLAPLREELKTRALTDFGNLHGTGKTSGDLKVVVEAAIQGRIEQLLMTTEDPRWGTVNPADGSVKMHSRQEAGDHDLVDIAACHALKNGAKITLLSREEMPDDIEVAAALLRY